MTPTQQGAFCKSCNSDVIDFSNKTENEVYEILTTATTKICGRFAEEQLNTPIRKTEINTSFFNWKAITASLAALIATEKISANNHKPQQASLTWHSNKATSHPVFDEQDSKITLKGKVINSVTGKPIAKAKISIPYCGIADVVTDEQGLFSIQVPAGFFTAKNKMLIASAEHHRLKQRDLDKLDPTKVVIMRLKPPEHYNRHPIIRRHWMGCPKF
ncbi:MAG: hypothetical protein JWO06_935 [Bacteroidota bacterium]|nr:hypothetical protein [Bacteroidota bacterium]